MRKGWKYKRIGDVCSVIGGATPKTEIKEFWGGSHYWITPADLNGNKYQGATPRTITDVAVQKTNLQLLPVGTVLLSSRAPIGKVAITTEAMYCNQGFKNIVCSGILNNEFVYWYLYFSKDYLNSLGTGATFKEISKKTTENIMIPVPPLQEQERIVAELDLLTEIIDKQKQQLKELDTLAQSIFYDMFGSPVENDKNWNINRLGGVLKTTSGGTPSKSHSEYYEGGTIPWVNSGDLHQMYIYSVQKFITQEGVDNSSAKLFPINSVLIAMYGATVGEVSILKIESTTNQAVCCIFPNDAYDSIFLYSVMKNSKHYFVDKASGGAQSNISQGVIKDFLLITPPIELQKSFAKKIQSIESQKQSINRSIAESQKLFDYTMDKYFG